MERFIQCLEEDFFIGRSFGSLNDLNAQLIVWLSKANDSVHGTTYAVPSERLRDEGMRSLDPSRPYIVTVVEFRKVTRDYFVSYKGSSTRCRGGMPAGSASCTFASASST